MHSGRRTVRVMQKLVEPSDCIFAWVEIVTDLTEAKTKTDGVEYLMFEGREAALTFFGFSSEIMALSLSLEIATVEIVTGPRGRENVCEPAAAMPRWRFHHGSCCRRGELPLLINTLHKLS